mmetsp:Transcript_72089/g.233192  ORF Transcript_72089/g.233192 Transcript_72089/m.233192 type:complete len:535 (-) Transcript_72089:23-1627(-)
MGNASQHTFCGLAPCVASLRFSRGNHSHLDHGGMDLRRGRAESSLFLGRYHTAPRRMEDDYLLDEGSVLGTGCNGVVMLARSKEDPSGPQRFAVKQLRLSGVAADQRRRLRKEAAIFLRMDHPHIARLFDVYESDEYLHIVMECMEGGELFQRLEERGVFPESEAADIVWQILLALNYIHCHGIVHRDIKLENFLYDLQGIDHLKMIDFGFSKAWDSGSKMQRRLGTMPYTAPEVLARSYTSQCDLWSLGVIVFALLSGSMPFTGTTAAQMQRISEGKYVMVPEKWGSISVEAKHFVQSLLRVDPDKRLSAKGALEHAWVSKRHRQSGVVEVDHLVVDALRQFTQASRFRRCCLEIMAWSLSNEERAKVREYFIALDANKHGTILLWELQKLLQEKFCIPDDETRRIFDVLDFNRDSEVQYSDFLAAMLNTQIALHDALLHSTFKKFDTDHSGFITVEDVRAVIGDTFDGERVEKVIDEAVHVRDRRISYPEFVMYLRGDPPPSGCVQAVPTAVKAHLQCPNDLQAVSFGEFPA